MLRQIQEIHQRTCDRLNLKKATVVIASWRLVQGFYAIIMGTTLLHFYEVQVSPDEIPLSGGNMFPNLDAVGAGFVTIGCVQAAISIGLFFNAEKSKPFAQWTKLSIFCTGLYTYLLIYQYVQYEMHKTKAYPFAEFVLFVMPILGEVLHWFSIYIVRCFFKDLEDNYDKYLDVPMTLYSDIVFYKVDK